MNKDIILITGASSDMGCELMRRIASKDNIIVAHYNSSEEKIKNVQAEAASEIIPLQADLLDEKDIYRLIDFIKKNYGFPNKIIHLPALRVSNIRFKDVQWQDFQKDIDLQLRSIVLILKEFLPSMVKEKKGKVVFMLSAYTLNVPPKALSHYTTVKYALLGLMKSLASEYADSGVSINAVSPSMVETDFLVNIPEKIVELNAASHPLKRNATVKDIIPAIQFLLSSSSDYINGINVPITGGSIF